VAGVLTRHRVNLPEVPVAEIEKIEVAHQATIERGTVMKKDVLSGSTRRPVLPARNIEIAVGS